ncbi:MAG: GGDEF domain-containing protein, partial [Bacilli bacterium]|nr:GGDEF domain-containing protein [Bacilli bacterium]
LLVYISTVFLILVASVAVVYLMKLRIKAAETDFLTGLSSKEAFEKLLKTTIQNAKKSQSNLSLLMIDIDNFKELNDHYGHLYGDEILKKVAQVMQDSIRKHDLSFRFGGDEFAIILPGINRDFAKIVANRIIREVNEIHQTVGSKDELSIHISIGISEWEEGISFIELIQKADKALYTAKTSGKNQVQLSE